MSVAPAFKNAKDFFLFKTIDQVQDQKINFFDRWKNFAGEEVSIADTIRNGLQ